MNLLPVQLSYNDYLQDKLHVFLQGRQKRDAKDSMQERPLS